MLDSEPFADMQPRPTGFGKLKIVIAFVDSATMLVGAVNENSGPERIPKNGDHGNISRMHIKISQRRARRDPIRSNPEQSMPTTSSARTSPIHGGYSQSLGHPCARERSLG